VSDLVAQQLNPADRREFAPELWISGVGALRKDKPDSIVPRRFLVIAEHNHDAVAYVHAKTGKHPANFGLQRHERFQHKRVRCPLSWLGGTTHDTDHNRLAPGAPFKPAVGLSGVVSHSTTLARPKSSKLVACRSAGSKRRTGKKLHSPQRHLKAKQSPRTTPSRNSPARLGFRWCMIVNNSTVVPMVALNDAGYSASPLRRCWTNLRSV